MNLRAIIKTNKGNIKMYLSERPMENIYLKYPSGQWSDAIWQGEEYLTIAEMVELVIIRIDKLGYDKKEVKFII